MQKLLKSFWCGAFTSLCVAPCAIAADELRLNQIQMIGSHNSYHIEPDAALRVIRQSEAGLAARPFDTLLYTHLALSTQLELGVRFFELDVYLDPKGDRFSPETFLAPIRKAGLVPDAPFDIEQQLSQPGTKVFHTPEDMRSTCLLLTRCLAEMRDWIAEHPDAGPVLIQFEPKEALGARHDAVQSWEALERDILAIVPVSEIYLPSAMAARPDALRQAAIDSRWPEVAALRGKFIFILNSSRNIPSYLGALKSGQARLMFPAFTDASQLEAAFVSRVKPDAEDTPALVRAGQIVITYADWRTIAARQNDTKGRDAAFRSGAQLIATDFAVADRRFSPYNVRFPEGYVRKRPESAER